MGESLLSVYKNTRTLWNATTVHMRTSPNAHDPPDSAVVLHPCGREAPQNPHSPQKSDETQPRTLGSSTTGKRDRNAEGGGQQASHMTTGDSWPGSHCHLPVCYRNSTQPATHKHLHTGRCATKSPGVRNKHITNLWAQLCPCLILSRSENLQPVQASHTPTMGRQAGAGLSFFCSACLEASFS